MVFTRDSVFGPYFKLSFSARLLIVLGADVAIVASENKKGEMRLSTRASNRIVSEGFNLTTVLESVENMNGG